ncbi:MAG: CBS domain-containing protein [Steroidobacteraceae bacterium]|nr:CBS domain-containing protein [Steroidobacteraceae bacterium]
MRVGDICSRVVCTARPEDPLAEAVQEMISQHVGSIVVVESRPDAVRPVGIVTDRDVVCGQIDRSADVFCLNVEDVMSAPPLTVSEDSGVAEALGRMSERGVRRAPVVDDAGNLIGIVTFDDLMPLLAEELTGLARLMGTQARLRADG